MTAHELQQKIRTAWADVPAPFGEDVEKALEWSLCDIAQDALLGIAPMDVDIHSPGFDAATPLFDLPPATAAAYLGTFLLSILDGLEFQEDEGLKVALAASREVNFHCPMGTPQVALAVSRHSRRA